jgi:outer membrane protein assembly factor BamB
MVCKAHQNDFSKAQCINCHQEICPDCIKEFGYFCGVACKQETREKTVPLLSSEEKSRLLRMDLKANRLANVIVWFIPLSLLLAGILFFGFKFFDKSGKVRWEAVLPVAPIFFKASDQILFCLFEKHLSAYDILSGQIRWDVSLAPEGQYLPFLVVTPEEIILADQNHFHRLDRQTGRTLRSIQLQNPIVSAPLADHEFVYCLTARKQEQLLDYGIREYGRPYQMLKVKLSDFQTMMSPELKLVSPDKLLLESEHLFIIDSQDYQKSILYCLDSGNGKIKWKKSLRNSFFEQIDPAFQGSSIFTASGKNITLYSIEGSKKWRKKFPYPISKMSVTRAGNPVILSSGKILGLNPQNGSIAWNVDIGFNEGSFLSDDDMIYVSGSVLEKRKRRPNKKIQNMLKPVGLPNIDIPKEYLQRRLYAIEGATGRIRWTLDHVSGNPLIDNSQLYLLHVKSSMNLIDASKFMGESSVLYCVHPSKGKKSWQQTWEGFTLFVETGKEGCFAVRSVQFFSPGDIFRGPKDPPKYYLVALYP